MPSRSLRQRRAVNYVEGSPASGEAASTRSPAKEKVELSDSIDDSSSSEGENAGAEAGSKKRKTSMRGSGTPKKVGSKEISPARFARDKKAAGQDDMPTPKGDGKPDAKGSKRCHALLSDSETESHDFRQLTGTAKPKPPALEDFRMEGAWQTKSSKRSGSGKREEAACAGKRKKLTKVAETRVGERKSSRGGPDKKVSYVIDSEDDDEEEEEGSGSEEEEKDGPPPIEKLLTMRKPEAGRREYLVKYKESSFRRCVWKREKELRTECPERLRAFLKKEESASGSGRSSSDDEAEVVLGEDVRSKLPEDYPSEFWRFCRIERIVADRTLRDGTKQYLVKWFCLEYKDSTWENETDIDAEEDKEKLEIFKTHSELPLSSRVTTTRAATRLEEPPEFKNGRVLRDYQLEGVRWLLNKWATDHNVILGDEMGLGKTAQSLATMEALRTKCGIRGPFLVVCPAAVIGTWQREIQTWTDMNVVVYHGSAESRELIRRHEWHFKDARKSIYRFHVLVTTYEIVMKDIGLLHNIRFQYAVVDEAHRLKGLVSKSRQAIEALDYKRLLLLTGTPIQNNLQELYSIMNLLDSDRYDVDELEERFGRNIKDLTGDKVEELQGELRERLLQRKKADVEQSIPAKEEIIIWVELTKVQRRLYKACLEKDMDSLVQGCKSKTATNFNNLAMNLRHCINHPRLLRRDEPDAESIALVESSGKMVCMNKLLPKLRSEGHRVLIFSQFVLMLDIMEDYLESMNFPYERLDGRVNAIDRQQAIDRYTNSSSAFAFLLSTRAGGVGITLTAADTVIIYDSDWNPQNDLQAMARCHRIGQTKDVTVYRLITNNCYEKELFETASRKQGLEGAILGNIHTKKGAEQNKEIENLLRRGAYDVLAQGDDSPDAAEFADASIEDILSKRTQKRLIGSDKGQTFSVAHFTAVDEEKKNVEEEAAEDFWGRMLPEAAEMQRLRSEQGPSPLQPRQRKQMNYQIDANDIGDEYMCSDDSGSDGKPARGRGKARQKPVKAWTMAEMKRLESRLQAFGPRSPDHMVEVANIKKRPIDEVMAAIDAIVYCWKRDTEAIAKEKASSTQSHGGAEAREAVDLDESDIPEPTENEKGSPQVFDVQSLPEPLLAIVKQRLTMPPENKSRLAYESYKAMEALSKAIESGAELVPRKLPRSFEKSKPAVWWGRRQDIELITSVHKHGKGAWEKVRADGIESFQRGIQSLAQFASPAKAARAVEDGLSASPLKPAVTSEDRGPRDGKSEEGNTGNCNLDPADDSKVRDDPEARDDDAPAEDKVGPECEEVDGDRCEDVDKAADDCKEEDAGEGGLEWPAAKVLKTRFEKLLHLLIHGPPGPTARERKEMRMEELRRQREARYAEFLAKGRAQQERARLEAEARERERQAQQAYAQVQAHAYPPLPPRALFPNMYPMMPSPHVFGPPPGHSVMPPWAGSWNPSGQENSGPRPPEGHHHFGQWMSDKKDKPAGLQPSSIDVNAEPVEALEINKPVIVDEMCSMALPSQEQDAVGDGNNCHDARAVIENTDDETLGEETATARAAKVAGVEGRAPISCGAKRKALESSSRHSLSSTETKSASSKAAKQVDARVEI